MFAVKSVKQINGTQRPTSNSGRRSGGNGDTWRLKSCSRPNTGRSVNIPTSMCVADDSCAITVYYQLNSVVQTNRDCGINRNKVGYCFR